MNRRSKHAQRGFTLIEVMMAITVLMVGATAIFTMQRLANGANMDARRASTAMTINRRFLDHLQLRSLQWGPQPAASLPWLDQVGGTVDWFVPVAQDDLNFESSWFGFPAAAGTGAFCTNLRLTALGTAGDFVRVDVRTWWHRDGRGGNPGAEASRQVFACADDPAPVTAALANARGHMGLGAVYASSVVRRGR